MNTNILEGFKCPECGSYEPFMIDIKTVGKVFDDGVTETFDNEWDDAYYCRCCECDHEGTVEDFQMRVVMVPDEVGNGLHEEYEE